MGWSAEDKTSNQPRNLTGPSGPWAEPKVYSVQGASSDPDLILVCIVRDGQTLDLAASGSRDSKLSCP